jgi:sugar phosphate permease
MIDEGVMDAKQMGNIGFALLIKYAIGKFVNGLLATEATLPGLSPRACSDVHYHHCVRFHECLLGVSAPWALNGWFQSMGASPCGASIGQWFSNRERGTRYSIWSMAHSLGEALTYRIIPSLLPHTDGGAVSGVTGIFCVFVALSCTRHWPKATDLRPASIADTRTTTSAPLRNGDSWARPNSKQ